MKVIVIASRKGGTGKTTISAHLAVEADRQGAGPVAVVDLDPMGGLANWWNERQAVTPYFARVGPAGLDFALTELAGQGVKLVVIDTPPAADAAIGDIIERATVVLAPVVPSPNDLGAIGQTMDLIEARRRPLVFVLNNAGVGTNLIGQARDTLRLVGRSQPDLYSVSPVVLHTRTDYRVSMIDGRTAGEAMPGGKAASEVEALWLFVQRRMKEGCYGTVAAA